jgi:ATP-dependent helicase/nuclease subunit A
VPVDLFALGVPAPDDLPQPVTTADHLPTPVSAGDRVWTEEQRQAIERRGGDLLLDAAAGSGKTSVLVERFVRAVLEDGVAVGEILTITFTEKAAAELRDRIRLRLRELGADEAARATETAFISTIHGFCARVLRAHALAAGLDPRFEVLDRERCDPLAAGAFDDALSGLADDEGPALIELIAAYTVPTLRVAILSAHEQLRSGGALAPTLPAVGPLPGSEVTATLHRAATVLARELGEIDSPSGKVVEALDRVQRALTLGDPAAVWPAELGGLMPARGGAALSTDACEAYREALGEFRAAAAAHAAVGVRDLLDGLLGRFSTGYAAAKAAVSGVDFTDLELFTRRLLAEDGELRERYRDRFAAIMVDELQDTNRVQLELIESIAHENLFTVGDAQQSIYGFRHADVELFRGRGRRLARTGARETLRTNFRTRPEIIDVLNPAFAEAMGDDYTPLRAGREPVGDDRPHVELLIADKGADWDLEGLASPWRLAEARALARRVARLVGDGAAPGEIVVLLRASTDMRAYERALESEGLATYVIGGRGYWSHPQVLDLVAYLRALANPRDEEPLYGVLVSPLVGLSLDGLVILAAAARRRGRDPWSVLREGPPAWEGIDEADVSRLSRFAQWFAGERARAARAGIDELIDRALTLTGYDLTMLALPGGRRRLANVRKLMRLGRDHEAAHGPDLRGFLALLADREAGRAPENREGEAPVEGEGLDAIRLMTIHRAKGLEFPIVCVADLGRSPRPPSAILRVSDDGRLGLRLARAGAGGRESALDYTAIGDEVRAAEEAEERRLFYVAMTRARERLLLSGAARLEGWSEGNAKRVGGGPIAWIAPAFVPELGEVVTAGGGDVHCGEGQITVTLEVPEDGEADGHGVVVQSKVPVPVVVAVTGAVPAAAVPAPPVDAPADPAFVPPPPALDTLSYSALAEYDRCGYRFYAERVLGLPGGEADGDGDGDGDVTTDVAAAAAAIDPADRHRGRRRGILAHALLERLNFRRPVVASTDVVGAAAVRAGLTPRPGPAELDGLAVLVRRFAESPLCARLGECIEVRREARFAFPLDDDPRHPLVVGALDVLAREAGSGHERALVVDYKTDRLPRGFDPAAIVARDYAGQQLVYAIAALHAGAESVEVIHCFLEAPESPVSAHFTRAELPQLRERLRARAAGVIARRFPVAPDPHRRLCAGCPAQGGLCSWPVQLTRRESADTLF